MLGFHAFSEAPFSDLVGDIKTGSASLSSTLTASASPTVHIASTVSIQTDASTVAEGLVLKLGQTDIVAASNPFDSGFNYGFQFGGTALKGIGTIRQNELNCTATIAADGTVTLGDVTFAGLATLQSQTNFTGKSVLLTSGKVGFNLGGGGRFDSAVLTSVFEAADTVLFTLYLDKGVDLSSYIDKERLLTLYTDKSLTSNLYVDKNLSSSKYVDKALEQILVRER